MSSRADRHNNPIAFTTELAKQAHLITDVDYSIGESFQVGARTFYTAKLLHDPLELCIAVLDFLGFYTARGMKRWDYIAIPFFVWTSLSKEMKTKVIHYMYTFEGGTDLKPLFTI